MRLVSDIEIDFFEPLGHFPEENTLQGIPAEVAVFTKKHIRNLSQMGDQKVLLFLESQYKLNDLTDCNLFLLQANRKLAYGSLLIGFVETYSNRKHSIAKKHSSSWGKMIYAWDSVIFRLIPKIPLTDKIYNNLTGGKGKLMSGVEAVGRLYAAGFELIEKQEIGGLMYFAARKVAKPAKVANATYWPVVKLPRVGKGGKVFNVYKLRTMYPYSEFLQDMVYERNNLTEGGKFKDDFRVSKFGKLLRKIWLDELPMIWNLLRGDIKLVGVRPLSKQYFNLYHDELKGKRIQFKPGLIPPYYADMPNTLEEIMASEMRYLDCYSISPFRTDIRYFFKVLKNILLKGARSR
jgi:lipopolysaccharide/colanic/teichoic acid biosynthesis glycosyltransferase